ncbi:MAG: hypothetical protein FWD44_03850 [Oscillospiraceae bacterium]|nr:hypothetical protein [Oscillospiraceae bacterium]
MSIVSPINNTTAADNVVYTRQSGVDPLGAIAENSEAFSALLSEAINGLTSNTGLSNNPGMMGMPGSFMPMPSLSNTLEQAIMTASNTGDSNNAMVALLMLMMMMQSSQGGGGGDMGMMMQMMASMIGNMQDKENIRDDFMFMSGGEPFTLDTMDSRIFNRAVPHGPAPAVSGTNQPVLPLEWWRPTTPAISSTINNRSASLYTAVVDQFNVEQSERYRPGRQGNTYCNIFAWDVTRAMGAELPYYTDPKTGAPMIYPDIKGAKYMMARDMDKWLEEHGPKYGWHQVDAEAAQMHANAGRPVVTSANHTSHMQVVIPSKDGNYDPVRGVAIAQAGRIVSNYMHISGIYGANTLKNNIRYWVHA